MNAYGVTRSYINILNNQSIYRWFHKVSLVTNVCPVVWKADYGLSKVTVVTQYTLSTLVSCFIS